MKETAPGSEPPKLEPEPESQPQEETAPEVKDTAPAAPQEPLSRKEIRRRMRKRMSRYTAVVKAKADINLRKSKMFERTLNFLSSAGTVELYKELMDYITQYGLRRKDAEVERYQLLVENATGFCLDNQVMLDADKVQDKKTLAAVFSALKDNDIDFGQIAEDWNGAELQSWMETPVVAQYLKMLKQYA